MKKILFGITSLTIGGAERVLVDLANRLASDYDVTIFTIYDNGVLKKQLNSNVKTISLYGKTMKEYNRLQRIKISLELMLNKKAPDGYDTYIAFLEGPITRLFSKVNNQAKKVAWVHNDISKVFGEGFTAKCKLRLDKRLYKKYDKIIFVSKENEQDFVNTYGKEFDTEIIRNYLDYNEVIEKSNEELDLPFNKNDINLVTVCRLVEQKALDRFINVHKELEAKGVHSKVYIIGDGPLRLSLQKQIDSLGETENFYLLGEKENPYPYIKNADYFCLLSYFEGYGMVLDEAKILNKKIIITNTAAKESIENYSKGAVVENTEKGVYEGLKRIISNDIEVGNIEASNADVDHTKNYYDEILKKIEDVL